jgi:hypothetical protein
MFNEDDYVVERTLCQLPSCHVFQIPKLNTAVGHRYSMFYLKFISSKSIIIVLLIGQKIPCGQESSRLYQEAEMPQLFSGKKRMARLPSSPVVLSKKDQ